ncbi:hypothetical protein CCHL11_00678 [Colletotrichum chlorophyti]|uniref:Uncharacterized protein n=1 Tax=Colletotrichum chlorophyti TaxID=708187 RepID=A0A1Q8S4P0_9PEZI|nr:hypothetical protein CCHL11_00678 [Colletotrichum chlorophyti]
MFTSLFAVVLGLAARGVAQGASCYAPNGDLANNETYVPCNKLGINQAGVFSSCCALDGPPEQRDICSSSGLCINRQGQPQRGFCTDKTWKSKACVHSGGSASNLSFMTACNDGTAKYCCGKSNTTCCGTPDAISISTQDSVCTANTTNSDDGNIDDFSPFKSATIGLAVVSGVSLLAGLLCTLWLWRQNTSLKRRLAEITEQSPMTEPHTPAPAVIQPHHTGSTSMHGSPQQYKSHYSTTSNSDFHPGNAHRYSELDASVATARSEMGSPTPYDQSHQYQHQQGRESPVPGNNAIPMHSPYLPQS